MRTISRRACPRLALAVFALALSACGQGGETTVGAEDFYRGRTIEIVVGFSSGGGFDAAARVLARHIGKHIPGNPTVIVRNQPGAGSLVAANSLNVAGPKDGSVIGIFSDTVPFSSIWNNQARFDARNVGWLGSITTRGTSMVLVRSDAPATTLEGLRKTEITVGATGPESTTNAYAKLANDMLDLKLKPVLGYSGSSEIYLAMERGEVHGRASSNWEIMQRDRPTWVSSGFAIPVVLLRLKPEPTLPGVPPMIDLAKNEEDRRVMELVLGTQQFGRTFSVPAGVPPDRLAALRQAFRDTVADPEFLEDAKHSMREKITIAYPDEIEAFVKKSYAYSQAERDRASQYIGSDD